MVEGPIPGLPTFYFFMIVSAVGAVVVSLVSYKLIQQARIPKFVKKARAMKSAIQGKKSISDSLLYPEKGLLIAKELGDKYEILGIALEDILGVKGKKGKEMPDIKDRNMKSEGGAL